MKIKKKSKIKKKTKKFLTLILAFAELIFCIFASAISKPVTAEAKSGKKIKVLTNRTDIVDTELKAFSDKYTAETGIEVEWEAVTAYDAEVPTRIRSNTNMADVLIIPSISPDEYKEYFEPLGEPGDSVMKNYTLDTSHAVLDENGKMKVYGLTYGLTTSGIVYNKKAFEKAGIKESDMKTIDGFFKGCKKLKEKGIIPVATNLKATWPLENWFKSAQSVSGNEQFINTLYKETSPFSQDKPLGEILEIIKGIACNGYGEPDLLNNDWEESKVQLAEGKVAMMFLGSWIISQEKAIASNPDDIGFMPVPVKSGESSTFLTNDHAYGVSSKSSSKEEAKDFLFKFLNSDFASKNGFIPNYKENTEMDSTIKAFLDSGVKQLVDTAADSQDAGKTAAVLNKAYINKDSFVQKLFLYGTVSEEKFDYEVEQLNLRWNTAKQELGV